MVDTSKSIITTDLNRHGSSCYGPGRGPKPQNGCGSRSWWHGGGVAMPVACNAAPSPISPPDVLGPGDGLRQVRGHVRSSAPSHELMRR